MAVTPDDRLPLEAYRTLLDYSTDLVAVIEAGGIVRFANPSYERVLGYKPEEIVGTSSMERIHPDDREAARASLALTGQLDGPQRTMQFRYRHKNGSWRILEATSTNLLEDPTVRAYVVNSRDVTERVLAERQILEKEAQYRGIFESTSDAVVIADMNRHVVEVNPAACRMYGYSREEMVGLEVSRLFHPDYLHVMAQSRHAAEQQRPIETESINMRKDGTQFHAEAHGSTFIYRGRPHILVVARDISERVQAYEMLEQRVQERTRELATLLDVTRNVASTLELAPLLAVVLEQLKSVVDFDVASIVIREGDEAIILDSHTTAPNGAPVLQRVPLPRDANVIEALNVDTLLLSNNDREDSREARVFRRVMGPFLGRSSEDVRSWMGVRLASKDRVVGMLMLGHTRAGFYSARHEELALGIAGQAALAVENAQLYEQARDLAALEERQRLARELHDSVSQALYGIVLGAKTARALLERDPQQAGEPLDYVLAQADAGLAEMRALIFELRPEMLQAEGLVAVLHKQVTAARARHHLPVHATLGSEPDVPFPVKEALYRIAQEALHNVVKHAHATEVHVAFDSTPDGIVLEIRDNGRGFDPSADYPGHIGLQTMRERAVRLGGSLEVESTRGHGSCLRVWVPQSQPAVQTTNG